MNHNVPKVAVITRTKDRVNFLERAIQSVSGQTYGDYVHVIVNDGGSRTQIEQLIDSLNEHVKDKISLFHRDQPSGAPDTIFNESIDRIASDYVVVHDDDDTWHPEFLERTVPILEQGAAGIVVRTDKVTETIQGSTIVKKKSSHYMSDMKAVSLYRQCIDNQLTPIAFIYSRDAYEKVGKFDESLPVVGDWEFGIRFLMKYDVEYLDPGFALAMYHHRTHKNDNSFAVHNHLYYFNKTANKYLRNEFISGQFGPGYIMSKIKYDQSYVSKLASRVLPSTIVSSLKNRIRK